jgi:hypothetical protein
MGMARMLSRQEVPSILRQALPELVKMKNLPFIGNVPTKKLTTNRTQQTFQKAGLQRAPSCTTKCPGPLDQSLGALKTNTRHSGGVADLLGPFFQKASSHQLRWMWTHTLTEITVDEDAHPDDESSPSHSPCDDPQHASPAAKNYHSHHPSKYDGILSYLHIAFESVSRSTKINSFLLCVFLISLTTQKTKCKLHQTMNVKNSYVAALFDEGLSK